MKRSVINVSLFTLALASSIGCGDDVYPPIDDGGGPKDAAADAHPLPTIRSVTPTATATAPNLVDAALSSTTNSLEDAAPSASSDLGDAAPSSTTGSLEDAAPSASSDLGDAGPDAAADAGPDAAADAGPDAAPDSGPITLPTGAGTAASSTPVASSSPDASSTAVASSSPDASSTPSASSSVDGSITPIPTADSGVEPPVEASTTDDAGDTGTSSPEDASDASTTDTSTTVPDDAGDSSGGDADASIDATDASDAADANIWSDASDGGTDGATECAFDIDCPVPVNPCLTAMCMDSACMDMPLPSGTPIASQTSDDCQVSQCDGLGSIVGIDDDLDVPVDGNQCTEDLCATGTASNPSTAVGTPCNQNGGAVCDGDGRCLECNTTSDCSVGSCVDNVCDNNCVFNSDCASGMCYESTCVASVNGCDIDTATDFTAGGTPTITFANGNFTYAPKCIKVSEGTVVQFNGNFTGHPHLGGVVINGSEIPAISGPFVPVTNSGTTQSFTMSDEGTFPYYCVPHGASQNMNGAVFVIANPG